jgi:hypothetical protein
MGNKFSHISVFEVKSLRPTDEFIDGKCSFALFDFGDVSLVSSEHGAQKFLRKSETLSVHYKFPPQFFIECLLGHIDTVQKRIAMC